MLPRARPRVGHFAPFNTQVHAIEPGDVAERYGAKGMGPSMYIRDPDGNVVELKGVATAE